MAYPPTPVRQYSFTDHSTNTPTVPQPGDRLDSEIDRSNGSIAQTISYLGISLNTDGTLKSGSVGQTQLAPGLFDYIGDDAVAQVQPLVTQAQAYAGSANTSATDATTSANSAALSANDARGAANTADNAALDAADWRDEAQVYANTASAAATNATNSDNHATGSANLAEDWADVSIEWAEHMPDTIPPNILAMTAITGDHWSSRWWANRAHELVEAGICDIYQIWLGAYATPPSFDRCGRPIILGATYYNTADGYSYIATAPAGTWTKLVQAVPAGIQEYIYLPLADQSVFTGPDSQSVALIFDPAASSVDVHLNGVKQTPGIDYTLATNTVTFIAGVAPAGSVVDIVVAADVTPKFPATGHKANPAGWVLDGLNRDFALNDILGVPMTPATAVDVYVSLDGIIQEPGKDYILQGLSTIAFTVAPRVDATLWMVVGLLGGLGNSATIAYQPAAPAAPVDKMLWVTPSATMFIWDAAAVVWLQIAGLSP